VSGPKHFWSGPVGVSVRVRCIFAVSLIVGDRSGSGSDFAQAPLKDKWCWVVLGLMFNGALDWARSQQAPRFIAVDL
jgi:hypothetical protein